MIRGSIAHEIFQYALAENNFQQEFLTEKLVQILEKYRLQL
jgi:hypothetical protein